METAKEERDCDETKCRQTLMFQGCSETGLPSASIPTQLTELYLEERDYGLECVGVDAGADLRHCF